MNLPLKTAAFISCVLITFGAYGQLANPEPGPKVNVAVSLDYSYIASGDVEFRGANVDRSDAQMVNPNISAEFPVGDKWFVPASVSTEHVFLDSISGAPVPERINVMRLSSGVGYRFSDDFSLSATAGPLFYDLERVGDHTLGVAGSIRGIYKLNPDLTLVAGLTIAPDSEYPVFPAVGVVWKARTNLTLNLLFPRPRLIYEVTKSFNAYAGAGIRFAVFRTDNDIASKTGVAGFNNALGTYRNIHLGAGVEYKLVKGLWASLEVGYSVGREIDYTRIDETVEFDSSPYVQAGVRWKF